MVSERLTPEQHDHPGHQTRDMIEPGVPLQQHHQLHHLKHEAGVQRVDVLHHDDLETEQC